MKNNKGRSGFFGGALSLTISALIVKILGLIYKIPLMNVLGSEGMGYFNSAYSVYVFFLMVCSAGVPKAVSIIITGNEVKEGGRNSVRIFRVCAVCITILGCILAAVMFFGAGAISAAIGNRGARECMRAIAPSLVFVALSGVIRGYLNGVSSFSEIALSGVIEGGLRLLFGLSFATLGYRHGMVLSDCAALSVLGITLSSLISSLYLVIVIKIKLSQEKTKQNAYTEIPQRRIIRSMAKIALPITFSSAVMSVSNIIDLGLIMRRLQSAGYSESGATSLYGNYTTLVVPMFNLVATAVTPVCMALLPSMTAAYAGGETEKLRSSLSGAVRIVSFLCAPVTVAFMLFPREILSLVFDDGEATVAAPMLALIAPAVLFMGMMSVVNTYLEAVGLYRAPLIAMSCGAVLKLASGYVLIGNENIGILGAPVGTVLCYAVGLIVSLIYLARRGGSVTVAFRMWAPLAVSAVALPLGAIIRDRVFRMTDSGAGTFVLILLCATLYLVFSFSLGIISVSNLKKMANSTKVTSHNYQ